MQFDRGYISPYFVTDPERMVRPRAACGRRHQCCPPSHPAGKVMPAVAFYIAYHPSTSVFAPLAPAAACRLSRCGHRTLILADGRVRELQAAAGGQEDQHRARHDRHPGGECHLSARPVPCQNCVRSRNCVRIPPGHMTFDVATSGCGPRCQASLGQAHTQLGAHGCDSGSPELLQGWQFLTAPPPRPPACFAGRHPRRLPPAHHGRGH